MALKQVGIGRGLDALLADVAIEKDGETTQEDLKQNDDLKQKLIYLAIETLESGLYQPRTAIGHNNSLEELAESIKARGVIQPIVVRMLEKDRYEIIAGERRWQAAKIAGLTHIPALLRNTKDVDAAAIALIENIQREDLNSVDEAIALQKLINNFGLTQEQIAKIIGRSRATVANLLRLLSLEEEVKKLLKLEKLDMGHARALLSLDKEKQVEIAWYVIENDLSVRETEKLIQKTKQVVPLFIDTIDPDLEHKTKIWNEILTRKLSSPVKIQLNKRGEGKVTIRVNSLKEIEWLVEHLKI